ncbi:MAG: amidohydrolase [Planctomycetota bacterium]
MRNVLPFVIGLFLIATITPPLSAQEINDNGIVVYHGALFYTLNDQLPTARAIAVSGDGEILAVGNRASVARVVGRGRPQIDLGGNIVFPGFIDAHGHLAGLGSLRLGVIDLSGAESFEEVIELVSERTRETPRGKWILGRGWDNEGWPDRSMPEHDALSEATPDHPVYLARVDGHAALANKAAMELAEISTATESPPGGEVLKRAGVPTGVFVDNAESLITRHIPAGAAGSFEDLVLAAQETCFASGMTGMHDMGVSSLEAERYRQLEADGKLKLRVHGFLHGNEAMRYFEENPIHIGDRFSLRGTKLYMDGAMGSRGAWLLEPYADRPTDNEGRPYTGLNVSEVEFIEAVAEHAFERGYQVAAHAIGDRANREVLDSFEIAMRRADAMGTDHRFRVEHAQLLAESDIPRFARLGVLPSMQQRHATSDMRWVEDRVGPERALGAYAWRSLILNGAIVPGGSDFPVEPHEPLRTFYAAVTRQNERSQPEGGWMPEQRMTREQALKSLTSWAAYAAFWEDRVGMLKPGMRADFVVLDRDIMTVPADEILITRVLRTVVDGETVYLAEEN